MDNWMSLVVEDNPWIFLILTVVFGGGAAFLAGKALATGWRPFWRLMLYMIPLGAALRFLHFSLFSGDLGSIHYFVTDTLVLAAAAALGYRLKRVAQMTTQYPWLYVKETAVSYTDRA
jgi:hypothetical protein